MERAVFAGSNNKGISTEKLKQALLQPVCVLRGVSRRLAVRMSKRSACCFPFAVFGDDGLTFKAKIRTILENFPKWLLWWGGYIYFGRKVLYDLVYYQRVMTILENKKGKDFLSLK